MEPDYNSWIGLPRYTDKYVLGLKAFLINAFPLFAVGEEMKCPCKNYNDHNWHHQDVIYDHLICRGPSPLLFQWICEFSQTRVEDRTDFMDCESRAGFGDNLEVMLNYTGKRFQNVHGGPNLEAKKFYQYVEEGKQALYHGFGDLLVLKEDSLSEAHVPLSFNAVKNMIKDLGLDYQKIHVCSNSCRLYWEGNKDKEVCDNCGVLRWVLQEKKGSTTNNDPEKLIIKVPGNVMRYFPLRHSESWA